MKEPKLPVRQLTILAICRFAEPSEELMRCITGPKLTIFSRLDFGFSLSCTPGLLSLCSD